MNTEIRSLIENWLEGDLGFEDAEQLRAWLRTDDAHLADFLREASLGRQLRDLLVGERMSAAVLDDLTTLEPVATCDPLVADEDSDSRATDSALPMPLRSRLVGVLGLILPEAISPRIHPGRFVVACLSLTVVFWAVLFAVVSQRPGSSEPAQVAAHNEDPSQPPIVAQLLQAVDASWGGDAIRTPMPGTHLRQGRTLELTSGLAEIRFESGATVILLGPTTFCVSDGNAGELRVGTLVARCDSPKNKGFAVQTPHVRLVDLGTEFNVVVDPAGTAQVHVVAGSVEAQPVAAGEFTVERSPGLQLEADEVAHFNNRGALSARFFAASTRSDAIYPRCELPGFEPIPLVNPSFELPGTDKIHNDWSQVPGWSSDSRPTDSGVERGGPVSDGQWLGFLCSNDEPVYQTIDYRINQDDLLVLQLDVATTSASSEKTKIRCTLYYDDEGTRHPFATREFLLDNVRRPMKLTIMGSAGDKPAAVGKRLGVELANVSTGRCWIGVDHVRLAVRSSGRKKAERSDAAPHSPDGSTSSAASTPLPDKRSTTISQHP